MNISSNQLTIVRADINRHIKVSASPGSGKSTVASRRIQYLMEVHGVLPNRILATMFNSDAVDEFKTSMTEIGIVDQPPVRTFHSLASRLLWTLSKNGLYEAKELETREWIVNSWMLTALKISKQKHTTANIYDTKLQEAFDKFITLKKGSLKTKSCIYNEMDLPESYSIILDAYDEFETIRKELNVNTFNDLAYELVNVMLTNPVCLKHLSNNLDYIIVDEFQDINPISYVMIKLIAGHRARLMVVGDDDQAINVWAGADPMYLIKIFDADYEDPLKFELDVTWRYGHSVSMLANNLIKNNPVRIEKTCKSPKDKYTKIKFKEYSTDKDISFHCYEQPEIITEINECKLEGIEYRDIAILLRVHSMGPFIEVALLKNSISYNVEDVKSVINSKEYEALNGLLCLVQYKDAPDDRSYKWIKNAMSFPRLPIKNDILNSVFRMLTGSASSKDKMNKIKPKIAKLRSYSHKMLVARCEAILEVMSTSKGAKSRDVIENYKRTATLGLAIRKSSDEQEVQSRSQAMLDSYIYLFCEEKYTAYDSLKHFLKLKHQNEQGESSSNHVNILTVHKSKGLGFKSVIIPGLSDGMFPYAKNGKITDVESERRLCFVAMTRAKQRLTLIAPKDESYRQSLKDKSPHSNSAVKMGPNFVSRFVYESDFQTVEAVSEGLNGNNKLMKYSIGSPNRGYINNYLKNIESDMRIKK